MPVYQGFWGTSFFMDKGQNFSLVILVYISYISGVFWGSSDNRKSTLFKQY